MSQDPSHRHAKTLPSTQDWPPRAASAARGRPVRSPQPRSPRRAGKWAIPAGDRVIAGVPAVGSPALSQPPRHAWTDSPHLPLVRGSRVLPAPSRSIRRAGPRAGSRGPREAVPFPGRARSGAFLGAGRAAPLPAPRPRVRPLACARPAPRTLRSPGPPPGGAAAGSRQRPCSLGPRDPRGFRSLQGDDPSAWAPRPPEVTPQPRELRRASLAFRIKSQLPNLASARRSPQPLPFPLRPPAVSLRRGQVHSGLGSWAS